jgi:hypothetical protein
MCEREVIENGKVRKGTVSFEFSRYHSVEKNASSSKLQPVLP